MGNPYQNNDPFDADAANGTPDDCLRENTTIEDCQNVEDESLMETMEFITNCLPPQE
jgi:hypothetical protein